MTTLSPTRPVTVTGRRRRQRRREQRERARSTRTGTQCNDVHGPKPHSDKSTNTTHPPTLVPDIWRVAICISYSFDGAPDEGRRGHQCPHFFSGGASGIPHHTRLSPKKDNTPPRTGIAKANAPPRSSSSPSLLIRTALKTGFRRIATYGGGFIAGQDQETRPRRARPRIHWISPTRPSERAAPEQDPSVTSVGQNPQTGGSPENL